MSTPAGETKTVADACCDSSPAELECDQAVPLRLIPRDARYGDVNLTASAAAAAAARLRP